MLTPAQLEMLRGTFGSSKAGSGLRACAGSHYEGCTVQSDRILADPYQLSVMEDQSDSLLCRSNGPFMAGPKAEPRLSEEDRFPCPTPLVMGDRRVQQTKRANQFTRYLALLGGVPFRWGNALSTIARWAIMYTGIVGGGGRVTNLGVNRFAHYNSVVV